MYKRQLSSCFNISLIRDRIESPILLPNGKVRFQLYAPSATTVYVAGEFNDWNWRRDQDKSIPLEKGEDDIWRVDVYIPPGRYQYKFVIDGTTWILDPSNPTVYRDPSGYINSLLIVK